MIVQKMNIMNPDNPIVMYLIVRESLNMSIGKTAAQVGHAVQYLCKTNEFYKFIVNNYVAQPPSLEFYQDKIETYRAWDHSWHRKIVLKADEKEWLKLKSQLSGQDIRIVIDKGLTELAAETETIIGLYPMYKNDCPKIIKRLQVLK